MSRLAVHGARGQVVLNGTTASFQDGGESATCSQTQPGRNRVVAELVTHRGNVGTWRLRHPGPRSFPGSLRPLAGTPMELTATSIAFRLAGKPGERVVFMFELAALAIGRSLGSHRGAPREEES